MSDTHAPMRGRSPAQPAYMLEPAFEEGTVFGRLSAVDPTTTAASLPSAYRRVPAYCVRAAQAIDRFDGVFDAPSTADERGQ